MSLVVVMSLTVSAYLVKDKGDDNLKSDTGVFMPDEDFDVFLTYRLLLKTQ